MAARELLRLDDEARLIVSSGYSTDPVLSHCEKYGVRAAIPKPYRFEDVSRVLTHVLKKNGGDGRRRSILTEE